jgi:hypothetical protein
MVAKIEEYLRKKKIVIFSKRLVNEMTTFTVINGKAQALKSPGCHDDLIMGLAIGLWLRDIVPEFSINYDASKEFDINQAIGVVKSGYDQDKINHQARIAEMKDRLEKQGYQNLQPQLFNPFFFRK